MERCTARILLCSLVQRVSHLLCSGKCSPTARIMGVGAEGACEVVGPGGAVVWTGNAVNHPVASGRCWLTT